MSEQVKAFFGTYESACDKARVQLFLVEDFDQLMSSSATEKLSTIVTIDRLRQRSADWSRGALDEPAVEGDDFE